MEEWLKKLIRLVSGDYQVTAEESGNVLRNVLNFLKNTEKDKRKK